MGFLKDYLANKETKNTTELKTPSTDVVITEVELDCTHSSSPDYEIYTYEVGGSSAPEIEIVIEEEVVVVEQEVDILDICTKQTYP